MSRPYLQDGTLGLLNTPSTRYRLDGVEFWAMDNGCFTNKYPGDDNYLAYLGTLEPHRARCLFVTVPDVVGDGPATLARFPTMAARIRAAGWPVALVAQDGMQPHQIPWAQIQYLFIGGSTTWKLGPDAHRLILQAHNQGVRVHVGRVNSWRRYKWFSALGCHTVDGTYLAYGCKTNLPNLLTWITNPTQLPLGDDL